MIGDMRKYILEVLRDRFFPTPTDEEVRQVDEYLDTLNGEQEHKIYRCFKIIDNAR